MTYSNANTNWAKSVKGNMRCRVNVIAFVVEQRKDSRWWARCGDSYLDSNFKTMQLAMKAAERGEEERKYRHEPNQMGVE